MKKVRIGNYGEEMKDMTKLIGLVGTNSDQSTNRQLLQYMAEHYDETASIELVEIKGLPLFSKAENYEVLPEVQEIANKIKEADGVIISTPEYDHSVPAALSNALAWLSYDIYPFVDKPVMIVGASYGSLGSSRAQSHLHQILNAPELKARLMPSADFLLSHSLEAFDKQGALIYLDKVNELNRIFSDFIEFIHLMSQLSTNYDENKNQAENVSWEMQR